MYTTRWLYAHDTTIKVIVISIPSKSFFLPPLLLLILLIIVIFVIRALNMQSILLENFKYTVQYYC